MNLPYRPLHFQPKVLDLVSSSSEESEESHSSVDSRPQEAKAASAAMIEAEAVIHSLHITDDL